VSIWPIFKKRQEGLQLLLPGIMPHSRMSLRYSWFLPSVSFLTSLVGECLLVRRLFRRKVCADEAVSIGAALYIVVYALIGLTTVHPTGPIVLSSFALSMNVIPFVGSIPILINDPTKMGTAYGVWSSFVACNNILLEVTAGAIVSSSLPILTPS
jgi:hypothetical protein